MAAATFEGASLGPLFDLANAVDPRYVWPINQSVAIVTCSIYLFHKYFVSLNILLVP